jgi:alpha-1,3/alpha-1,6-mannosyltransferase
MASKKPVIACNSGGPMETVRDGETGFLCDPSPVQFANAMLKLAKDADLATRMGEEARKHVTSTFSTKIFGDKLNNYVLNIYHRRIE